MLNELCHLHYTNCRLKICIWQLYFYSWLSKVYLKIFLISSPEHALTTPCPWQMTQSAFCLCSYILIGNHVHVKSSGIAPGLANAWLLASRKVCQCPTRGTEKAGKCPSVAQILRPKKCFFFSFSKVARYCNLNLLTTGWNVRVRFHSENIGRKQMSRLPSFVKKNLEWIFS